MSLTAELNRKTQKILALIYFQKALKEERYEECRLWSDWAMDQGANFREIKDIILNPVKSVEGD